MKVTNDIIYVGVNDHKIDLFEGQYVVPNGMAYNSYVIRDQKIAVMDTVDRNFKFEWLNNLDEALGERKPDYLVVQHMEPDHSANIFNFMTNYPDATIVSSAKAFAMMKNFFGTEFEDRRIVVKEGDTLELGEHTLHFVAAPMVHWPEVIMTYDSKDKVLFSADGFGKFGALDVEEDWACEARRYYIGIVGKYGAQVQNVLKKAATLDIQIICPLHGPVLSENLGYYLNLYNTWSSYSVETEGIMIAYTSVYGNTKQAVELLAEKLKSNGCPKVVVNDLAREDMAECVEDAFRYGRIKMLEGCKKIEFVEPTVRIMSALSDDSRAQIDALAKALCHDYIEQDGETANKNDLTALFNIGYGLYVVTSNDGKKDNGLIVNTVTQVTNSPNRVAVCINKQNYSHHTIKQTGVMNVNCLSVDAPFSVFQNFGFQSGKNVDKFADWTPLRSDNGLVFLPKYINSFMSLKVEDYIDLDTHGMFICSVTEARVLSDKETMTYTYYQNNVKPKPETEGKKGWVCKICGYVYEGEELPEDFICPLCKHGVADFEPIE